MHIATIVSDRARQARRWAVLFLLCSVAGFDVATAQHTVAREWNEAILDAIRVDLARPPIQARNLFHSSVAMYDAWAAYDETASPYLLGRTGAAGPCAFDGVPAPADVAEARDEAISYAAYRVIRHRFQNSPGALVTLPMLDSLLNALGYSPTVTSTDYASGLPAALGNYVAACVIAHGFADGANEAGNYAYLDYEPVNSPMLLAEPGNPGIDDLNRWQPLTFELYIDQHGNEYPGGTPKFIAPEWGRVSPFALTAEDLSVYERDGAEWRVYHDPGAPPMLDVETGGGASQEFIWNFALVAAWGSHLDPHDGVMWDISPASRGNVQDFPTTFEEYQAFYGLTDSSTPGSGHAVNPHTGQPYEPQLVPRGDYTRVVAQFWADGPDTETPPGHWYSIFNYVTDHPLFVRRIGGGGTEVDPLEWDVKGYLTLGGAAHDAAISAWGIKGWYDYVRPISAIRAMAELGQSSEPDAPDYHPAGLSLIPGFIERVAPGDPLAGDAGEHVGKIKLYSWLGHDYIDNPDEDFAGVGWTLAENWWPFQRITFVTPPFAGYISGHSTYSSAAAEVMTLVTGDAYFPGGMSQFEVPNTVFLEPEIGPTIDLTLQWATYRDAANECSLSRIWGGIHPPIDDIPGRVIGEQVGGAAFALAQQYFAGEPPVSSEPPGGARGLASVSVYPTPLAAGTDLNVEITGFGEDASVALFDVLGRQVRRVELNGATHVRLATAGLAAGVYFVRVQNGPEVLVRRLTILR